MNKKLARQSNKELGLFQRGQMGRFMALASLSMSGTRRKHIDTSPSNDAFHVETLENDAAYQGSRHAALIARRAGLFESFTACNLAPILQSALAPYEGYLGVIDVNTSFHAIRFTYEGFGGHRHDYWHYSIGYCDPDLFPVWIRFASLRALAVYVALKRFIAGEIAREMFVMFCSDVISANAFLSLDKEIVQMLKP